MKHNLLLILLILSVISVYALANEQKDKEVHKEMVVLIHGLGRSNSAMWLLALRLKNAGYNVVRVGYDSLDETPDEILKDISAQIYACCSNKNETINFVGHSLGGLLIRAYLQDNKVENLGRVVLMGTPNQGTEIVDKFKNNYLMKLAGPTALKLGTDAKSFPKSLQLPYYSVGIIAGKSSEGKGVCKIFPTKNDGMVTVESSKLEGMTDFVLIETSHSFMRYDSEVASQVIFFLKNGKFDKEIYMDNWPDSYEEGLVYEQKFRQMSVLTFQEHINDLDDKDPQKKDWKRFLRLEDYSLKVMAPLRKKYNIDDAISFSTKTMAWGVHTGMDLAPDTTFSGLNKSAKKFVLQLKAIKQKGPKEDQKILEFMVNHEETLVRYLDLSNEGKLNEAKQVFIDQEIIYSQLY